MKFSEFFIPTYREIPSEAEIVSHQLMLRAGMIRKLTSGIYTILPIGLKCIRKIEGIIREEMNRAGAIELLMPAVQPAELWKESGRWDYYGRELLRFKDRHGHEACLGPTHEEIITDLVRNEIHSYRQLPVNFYQIQTKFRDETRPRFGMMRCREFIMKDAYSFDTDEDGANHSYEKMKRAYYRIFKRCGLDFRAVEADSGTIGGSYSHEFMVLSDTGEDQIVACSSCNYAANLEKAEIKTEETTPAPDIQLAPIEEIATPNAKTIEEVTTFLGIPPNRLVKTLIVRSDEETVAVLIRGDHELNEIKLKNFLDAKEIELADEKTVMDITNAPVGFAGPVGLKVRIVADMAVKNMVNFVTGGNKKDLHLKNVNLERDFHVDRFGDLRFITPEDKCPRCGKEIRFLRGIEVGHIFKLGTKYSEAMKAVFLDEEGNERPCIMGCYGIGVGRCLSAAIEQNNDEDGIILPVSIAPFEVIVLPLQIHDPSVSKAAKTIYEELNKEGIDVIFDDRDERPGVKFKDADLIGIPVRITVGVRGIKKGEVEVKLRNEKETKTVPVDRCSSFIKETLNNLYHEVSPINPELL
ncbi:MAG: proline--tRNA ligase [Deltaproteobacteria bacterium]|nr:proline--tRNA ligase [Deltaproteobacteria bacterium]